MMQLAKLEKLAKTNQKSSLLTPVIASGSHMTPACFVFCFFTSQCYSAPQHPREKHLYHCGWWCVLLAACELWRGVTFKHVGSCQIAHALGCSRMLVWPLQGVTRFLRSMENTVTGLDGGEERVMWQAEHMCGPEHVRLGCMQQCEDGWSDPYLMSCCLRRRGMRYNWALYPRESWVH